MTKVVVITGCDSGLGWALAARAARQGLVTVAGLFNKDTEAEKALKKLKVHTCELDVRNQDSVAGFREYVNKLIQENAEYKLYAIVNNAGVMTIGDYEWQTQSIIENTINVNLIGAMRVVSAFLPEIRRNAQEVKNGPRIINIASHCGLQPMPGFGAYSASKAGVLAWTQALRLELRPYGLKAVAFVPGGFVTSSKLLSQQAAQGKTMLDQLNDEQRSVYTKRITKLIDYLGASAIETRYDSVKDENILETFMKALTEENPRELYKVETWRYMIYYNLLKLPLPETIRYWLVKSFLSFPE